MGRLRLRGQAAERGVARVVISGILGLVAVVATAVMIGERHGADEATAHARPVHSAWTAAPPADPADASRYREFVRPDTLREVYASRTVHVYLGQGVSAGEMCRVVTLARGGIGLGCFREDRPEPQVSLTAGGPADGVVVVVVPDDVTRVAVDGAVRPVAYDVAVFEGRRSLPAALRTSGAAGTTTVPLGR